MNYINSSYFAPIFLDYLRNIKEVENCGYWQLPFIPYTFPKYQSSPLKVFYVGRDTYYWCEYDAMYDNNEQIVPELYLHNNADYVSVGNIEKDWNKPGSFWGMVSKLHLQLLTGVYHQSINELTESDWNLLEGIGYGNLFSIELLETLKKKKYISKGDDKERSEYDDIKDFQGYNSLRTFAKPFENLKTIFSAYGEPDIVFILSWAEKDDFFEGLDYDFQKDKFENYMRSVYISNNHKTKVIWSIHPSYFRYKKMNPQKMCQYLCDTAYRLFLNK